MIWFDTTKTGAARHKSGLNRLTGRLREEFGADATGAAWTEVRERAQPGDWLVTAEQFSAAERPGFAEFLAERRCRMAAIFADAIPLKHPQICWPQSVARYPGYMKLLAAFERVWGISEASRAELADYWRWLNLPAAPAAEVLPLGADFDRAPRVRIRAERDGGPPRLLCVGILEPRKNQLFLLEVAETLWRAGVAFELHVVGRRNPHFGAPIVARLKALRRAFPAWLHYHEAAPDTVLAGLYATATATVCPTIAEGCGLPLLESLWQGVPCVCSDLPVLRENAAGGGCVPVPLNAQAEWAAALRRIVTDSAWAETLGAQAAARALPTWAESAARLRAGLR